MFKNKDERLKATQSKLTRAANTIQEEILNSRSVKEQFSTKELETLRSAVSILNSFKDNVKHKKEKLLRKKKAASRVENEVRAKNQNTVNKLVRDMPINTCIEMSLLRHYGCDLLAEESVVSQYSKNQLLMAKNDPVMVKTILEHARIEVADMLLNMLPNTKYRSGYDTESQTIDDFLYPPEPSSEEFVVELIKKQMIHRALKMPDNLVYVKDTVSLINLARSVNQTIKDIAAKK